MPRESPVRILGHELRIAARRLRHDRWSAGGAILAAALGAGLNTAVFAVAYGILLRPLPYAQPDRLVVVNAGVRLTAADDWRRQLTSFEGISAFTRDNMTVRGIGDPRVAAVTMVDDEFFAVLGGGARIGRIFGRADADSAVVVSHRFAEQSGLPDARLLGSRLQVGEASLSVAGIMPGSFAFPSEDVDLWMPARAARAVAFDRSADARHYRIVGRLRAGVPLARARAEALRAWTDLNPRERRRADDPLKVESVQDLLVGPIRPALFAFAAAALIVLVIACANVATILVGRTLGRQRELAVRRALGASPSQLLLSIVSESLIVTSAGTLIGAALAIGAVRVVEGWAGGIIPRLSEIRVDWIVLLVASLVMVAASILSAAPALRGVRRSVPTLRTAGAGATRVSRRTRGVLIVVQISLAVVLLAGGGLLTRTIVGLLQGDIGVASRGAVISQLMLTEATTLNALDRGPLVDELLRRVRALPGVTAAGVGSNLPPANLMIQMTVRLVGSQGERVTDLSLAAATPGYLPAVGARLLQGRDFQVGDDRPDRLVAVISETAARRLMAPGHIIGHELPTSLPGVRQRGRPTVIGVVSDVKYSGLDAQADAAVYVMWTQLPVGHPFLAVRTSAGATAFAPALRAIERELDPRMPVMPVRTLDEVVARTVADRRLRALLGGSVALLAFAVAMVGLAGSLMRIVLERRQELAIRAALGASPARAVRTIMSEGVVLAACGVALGVTGALVVGRALRTLLHGVSPYDPLTLGSVAIFVGVVSLLACYVPARRAARVDPLLLLRTD